MAKKFLKRFLKYAFVGVLTACLLFRADLFAFGASEASVSCFSDAYGSSARAISCFGLRESSAVARRVDSSRYKGIRLYAGGIPFGVKFMTDGVLVIGFAEISTDKGVKTPAKDAGLQIGDVILSVGGERIMSSSDLSAAVEKSGGKSMSVIYLREGCEQRAELSPAYSSEEGRYKSGIYVRDSGAGIGTVTYIMPETLEFGGLGHGICDGDTGKLIPDRKSVV